MLVKIRGRLLLRNNTGKYEKKHPIYSWLLSNYATEIIPDYFFFSWDLDVKILSALEVVGFRLIKSRFIIFFFEINDAI